MRYEYNKSVDLANEKVLTVFKDFFIENLAGDITTSFASVTADGIYKIEVKDAEGILIDRIEITPLLRHYNKVIKEVKFETEDAEEIKSCIIFDRIYNVKNYDKFIEPNKAELKTKIEEVFGITEESTDVKGLIGFNNYYKSIKVRVASVSPITVEPTE